MNGSTGTPPGGSKGVAVTNWLVSKASGFLEKKSSRRGFLIGSAMAGSAVAVAGCVPMTRPGPAYSHITDCAGGLCADGYTEFCCTINDGVNGCPPDSFWGGWWRADYSTFCNGTRYYIDCMQYCCGPKTGYQNFCAGCTECRCASGCDTRRVYCNYFRYGQCHTDIVATGPIACRVVLCVPPYSVDPACSTATLVDNATAEHTSPCITNPPVSLPRVAAASSSQPGTADVFYRAPSAAIVTRHLTAGAWSASQQIPPAVTSALAAASDDTATYVFGRGNDNTLWYNRFDGTTWQGQQSLSGVVLGGDPVAVASPTGVHVFVVDTAHAVWYGTFTGGSWSGWTALGGTVASDVAAVSSTFGVWVFARGDGDYVWYRLLGPGGWGAWAPLNGQSSGAPAVAADASGVYAFVRAGGGLWVRKFNGSTWEAWIWLGGYATGDPAAAAVASGVYVFMRSEADGGLWWNRLSGSTWSGFQPTNVSSGTPTAVADRDGHTVHVFVRAFDGNLYWCPFGDQGSGGSLNLGGPVAAGNALG